MWSPGFQWSARRDEWVPTPAGVLTRAPPALLTMDHHHGQWWPSKLARVPGPDWGHAAMGLSLIHI
eukprot:352099-Alexandrium_andersonii.AAC.1